MGENDFVAKTGDEGRITVPKAIRDIQNIETGDYLQVTVEKVTEGETE